MNEEERSDAPQAPPSQCSNAACQTTFTSPVQHCLTCGALLKGALLSERFRIEALLGRGGMGAVYRATDLALERLVAVKVLAPSAGVAGDAPQELRARFFREARVAAQLDHPNIVAVLHFDIDGPLAYLVMPLLTGGTLAQRLRSRQPCDPVTVSSWLHQMADALDFAHQRPQPIVHRDVKPGNLLFREDGRLCLADFGIARVVAGGETGEAAHLTRTGMVLGSLAYMAPEQINGRAVPASDQYSAGVVVYEALTGTLPFNASENYGLIIQHASATPLPPSEHVPTLPGGIDAVIMRALAKQPSERFPTVGTLAAAFDAALTSAPHARIAGQGWPRATRPIMRHTLYELGQHQGGNEPLADDERGERPTEAVTMMRAPHGQTSPYWGGPPSRPPTAPRRSWLMPALFIGLAAILLCVVGLAGLSALNHNNNTRASSTTQTTLPSPTPTATPDPHLALLTAAEAHTPRFQDELNNNSKRWTLSGSTHFQNGVGLRLSNGDNRNATDASAIHSEVPLNNGDIEVDVTVSNANASYGFAFLPGLFGTGRVLVLTAQGGYVVEQVAQFGRSLTPLTGTETQGSTLALALTPNQTYHLAVLIHEGTLSLYLGQPGGQDMQFVTDISYDWLDGTGRFGLVNFTKNTSGSTSVTYSNLKMYPLE